MKTLVAEDDSITRKLLEAHLVKWGHQVVICANGKEAWEALNQDDAPRLVILDWMMPEIDGVTLCRQIRSREGQPYTYVILLTAKTSKDDVIQGLEAGADDYILKPFDAHELRVRVRAGSRIIRLQEDLMASLAASEYQGSHDALTGLWNRRAILDLLNAELARMNRLGNALGVIIADLDHFKRINDAYGHLAGDAVLREVATRMMQSVRPFDFIGRYGGEEFLIVCPGGDADSTAGIAERLRCMLQESPLITPEGVFDVTISCGVACCCAPVSGDTESVIRRADQALYSAKELGRNRVEAWQEHEQADDPADREPTNRFS